jgi:glycosyltransferase involved in cell wall biosynthesis
MTDLSSTRPRLICVTPVRNEEWILGRFLQAAELWADEIIVADQGSTDATREIAARFAKVRLIDNPVGAYDEGARQRLLLGAAREVPGPRVVIALDADEALAGGSWETEEWEAALRSAPGTVLRFHWVNLLPDGRRAYIPAERVPFGFVDDGTDHEGSSIHSTRVPVPARAPVLDLDAPKVLHLQYTDWPRMQSKQRWYQAWERIHHPAKRPVQIYRQYHRMDAFPPSEVHPLDPTWLAAYEARDIRLAEHARQSVYWWDVEVVRWLAEHGSAPFRRIDLWDVDWQRVAAESGVDATPRVLSDPRSALDRRVHGWLARTQGSDGTGSRLLQRLLIPLGW